MINKIQKYLLLNYPTLWNIKLFPMLLILAGVHLFFGFIGYLAGTVSFDDTYYRSIFIFDDGSLFVSTIFLSIFIFIGWMVFYMRHNALKNFYPKKTTQLYGEWLLILIIVTGIALIPASTTLGALTRVKAIASQKECEKALNIIARAKALAPDEIYYFNYNDTQNTPIPIPANKIIDLSDVNLKLYNLEYDNNGKLHVNGYIGPSLLFYNKDYYRYNYSYNYSKEDVRKKEIKRVNKWLVEEQRDSIYQTMVEFNKLQKKHNLDINITPEEWLKRVYNPPFYPVNNSSSISNYKYGSYYYNAYNRDYDHRDEAGESIYIVTNMTGDTIMQGNGTTTSAFIEAQRNTQPYLQLNEVEAAYAHILNSHTGNEDLYIMFLVIFCISVWLSIFVFSYRLTNGKSWLIAFVASGVLFFLILFIGAVVLRGSSYNSEVGLIFVLSFWLCTFIGILIYLIYKVSGSKIKGFSNTPMNMFLWLVPCILPLIFFNVYCFLEIWDDGYFRLPDAIIQGMFWTNLVVVIIAMFPVIALAKRWKGIAEE